MLQTKRIYRTALLSCVRDLRTHAGTCNNNRELFVHKRHMLDALEKGLRTNAEYVPFDANVMLTLIRIVTNNFGGEISDLQAFCELAGISFVTNVSFRSTIGR